MKVTLHLEGSRQEIQQQIAEFSLVLETSLAAQKPAAEKKAAPKKAAAKEEPQDEPETEDAGEMDDFGMDDDAPEEAEEPTGPTLGEVQQHIKKYAAKSAAQKDRAKKLMAKLGIKAMDKIPAQHFAAILKNLN